MSDSDEGKGFGAAEEGGAFEGENALEVEDVMGNGHADEESQESEDKDARIEELEERVEALEEVVEEFINPDLIDTFNYTDAASKLKDNELEIDKLQEEVEEIREEGVKGPATIDDDMTVLEKYSKMPEDVRETHLSAVDQRAIKIFENFDKWAQRTPEGDPVISTKQDLRKYLETAVGESLQPGQVHDSMERVGELSERYKYRDKGYEGKVLKRVS